MNRRNFLQVTLATLAAAVTRKWPAAAIEIVGYELDEDAIMGLLTFGPSIQTKDGISMTVSMGTEQEVLDAMTFIDSNGGRYTHREIEALANL